MANKRAGQVADIMQFVDSLEAVVKRELRKAQPTSVREAMLPGASRRIAELKSAKATMFTLLRELANDTSVAEMNNEQLEGYLMGTGSGSKARRLAKRAGTNATGAVAELTNEWIGGLRERLLATKAGAAGALKVRAHDTDNDKDDCCFIDNETTVAGLLAVAQQLDNARLMELTLPAALTLFGQTGVAVSVKKGPLPDPWQVAVTGVHADTFVSQQALYERFRQDGVLDVEPPAGRVNAAAVSDAAPRTLNGCVPLVQPVSGVYQVFMRSAMAKVQASITLRQTIATVPGDQAALLTSTWMWLVTHSTPRVERLYMDLQARVRATLRLHCSPTHFADIHRALRSEQPEALLTGRQNVSHVSKVVAAVLTADPDMLVTFDAARVLRAVHWMQCYRRWKHADGDVEATVLACLGVPPEVFAARQVKPQPPMTPEPAVIRFDTAWRLSDLAGEVKADGALRLVKALFPGAPLSAHAPCVDRREVRLRNVCAMQCRGVSDFVAEDGTLCKPLHASPEGVFRDFVRRKFEEQYQSELAKKQGIEAAARLERNLAELRDCRSPTQFVELLQAIAPQAHATHYKEAEAAAVAHLEGGFGRFKVCVLCCGHRPDGTPVWNNGSPNPRKTRAQWLALFHSVQDHREATDGGGAAAGAGGGGAGAGAGSLSSFADLTWEGVVAILDTLRRVVYRPSGNPNRHGHCDVCPSWFCLGYASKQEFLTAMSDEYLAAYDKARRANKHSTVPHSVEQFL